MINRSIVGLSLFLYFISLLNMVGQNCIIPNEFVSEKILEKNKVKVMHVWQGQDSARKLLYIHHFSPNGCTGKRLYYDLYSKTRGPIQSTYELQDSGRKRIFSNGRLNAGKYEEMENIAEYYNRNGKLIRRVKKESADILTFTICKYDTANEKKIDINIFRLMPNGDSISKTKNFFDQRTRIFSLKYKTLKGWEESEKLITTYSNGFFEKEEYYSKGILTRTVTKSEYEKQNNATVNAGGPSESPLPFSGNPIPDSSYTDDVTFSYGKQTSYKKNLPFLVVRHPMLNDSSKTDHYDVYDQRTGLLQRRISFSPNLNLVFNYTY